ncbi:MAG: hypothetical protein AB7S71_07650 [Dongiaceae bacterium]
MGWSTGIRFGAMGGHYLFVKQENNWQLQRPSCAIGWNAQEQPRCGVWRIRGENSRGCPAELWALSFLQFDIGLDM